jgi:hypothetical protein
VAVVEMRVGEFLAVESGAEARGAHLQTAIDVTASRMIIKMRMMRIKIMMTTMPDL